MRASEVFGMCFEDLFVGWCVLCVWTMELCAMFRSVIVLSVVIGLV